METSDKLRRPTTLAKTMQGNNIARIFCHDRCGQFVFENILPVFLRYNNV